MHNFRLSRTRVNFDANRLDPDQIEGYEQSDQRLSSLPKYQVELHLRRLGIADMHVCMQNLIIIYHVVQEL